LIGYEFGFIAFESLSNYINTQQQQQQQQRHQNNDVPICEYKSIGGNISD